MSVRSFVHHYIPPRSPDLPIFLLLHGTGGDERSLLPLLPLLQPGAGSLGVRGNVLENGMPRFFRRLAVGVLDEDDLRARSIELVEFVNAALVEYGISREKLITLGLSNGSNIALGVHWDHPGVLPRSILFRGMTPYRSALPAAGAGVGSSILLAQGEEDPFVSRAESAQLAEHLRGAGASVTLKWAPGGHSLQQDDITSARDWLAELGATG